MTTALLDRLTHHCNILDAGNDSFRFRASAAASKTERKNQPLDLEPATRDMAATWVTSPQQSTGGALGGGGSAICCRINPGSSVTIFNTLWPSIADKASFQDFHLVG